MNNISKPAWFRLKLKHVRCASCVARIENELKKVSTLSNIQINFAQRELSFSSAESEVTQAIQAVQKAGYDASIISTQYNHQQIASHPLIDHFTQAWIAGIWGLALMLIDLLNFVQLLNPSLRVAYWSILCLITLIVMWIAGFEIFINAWRAFIHRHTTMDTLITLGVFSAWIYSVITLIAFPQSAHHLYLDACSMILFFVNLGAAIDARSRKQTATALEALIALQPTNVILEQDGQLQEVTIEQVKAGDIVIISTGSQIPVDGLIVSGKLTVNESMLTGEAFPAEKTVNDPVYAGTVNQLGQARIKVSKASQETILAQMIEQIMRAQNSKPPIAKLADQIASYFVPAVLIIACITAVIWALAVPDQAFYFAFQTALSVLIIACPCALGLATPLAVSVGIGHAAKYGILVKDAATLQQLNQIDTLVFDKTGTLTEGQPSVTNIISFAHYGANEVLKYAASLAQYSSHPLAQAIVNGAKQQQIQMHPCHKVEEISGLGMIGELDNKRLLIGNSSWLKQNEVVLQKVPSTSDSEIHIALNHLHIGTITLTDALRPDAIKTMNAIKKMHLQCIIVSGDKTTHVTKIAAELGVDTFQGDCLPQQKVDFIQKLKKQGRKVGMLGDGINDAPALSEADVSFAMSSSSQITLHTADITFMRPNLFLLVDSIQLAHSTVKKIKQNLFAAFIYNIVAIPIAAGVLFPLTGWLLNPMIAAAAMMLSSLTVVFNSLLFRKHKKKSNKEVATTAGLQQNSM